MLDRLFRFLQRRATWVMLAALLVGLALPPLARAVVPFIFPLAVGSMLFSLARMDWMAAGRYLARPGLPLLIGAGAMIVAPVAVRAIGAWLVPEGSPIVTGMTLIAATPPLVLASAYAVLFGIDSALAVAASIPANLAAPAIMPLVVSGLLGLDLEIEAGALALRLVIMVGVAFAGAAVVRRTLGAARSARGSHYLDGAMLICMCSFGIGLMDGIPDLVTDAPLRVLVHVGGAFALSVVLQGLAIAVAWRLGPARALTVGMLVGMRNGVLVLGAVGDSAGPEVRLFLVCFQFPLYMLPALMHPAYARLLRPGPSASQR